MNEKVKRTFEEPKVEKVEFDFKTRIAASYCGPGPWGCTQDGACESALTN
jgi:hypothetical protein